MLNGMHLTLLSDRAAVAVSLALVVVIVAVCSAIVILGKAALDDAPAADRPDILHGLAAVASALLRFGISRTGRRQRPPPRPRPRRSSPRRRR
jgi:hypothetical protein